MSNKYYRGLRNSLNDTKYKLQIASMTLKINENINNINGIKSDISGINDFSDKIDTNENDISSNLGILNTNKIDISSNLEKVNTNKSNILSNLNQINNIKLILPTLETFKKVYSIKNQSFKFNSNIIFFKLLEIEIENNFNVEN